MTRTLTYRKWCNMRNRCQNPKATKYPIYGARGIRVCERWQSFCNFLSDMGEAPAGMTLERKDNDKGYSLDNCVWASPTVQSRNRRNVLLIEYKGQKKCLSEWASILGVDRTTLSGRLYKSHWPVELAFETPIIPPQLSAVMKPMRAERG